jgi:caa(3)-type oxidase subunit IV
MEQPPRHDTETPLTYVKIWGLLLLLLAASVIGPMFERPLLTLITAFGLALVKAALVVTYFMRLNAEKRYIRYMLYAMLLMIGLLFAGTAPDLLQASGLRWQNHAVQELIEEHATDEHRRPHLP